MREPILRIENLKKTFFVGDNQVDAVKGITFDVPPGEFLIIFGPSGCGKSTLLSLMGGLDTPTNGRVYFKGSDIFGLQETTLAEYRRTRVGMVFQQFNLVPTLSALDNVALPLVLSGVRRSIAYKRSKELIEIVGLSDRMYHRPSEMSGGQQQRIAIARALSINPGLLLIDEPTGNLDVPTGNEIMDLICKINKKWGRTVVLVTHNPDFIKYGDRVMYMRDGEVVKFDQVKSVAPVSETKAPKNISSNLRGNMGFWETFRFAWLHFVSNKLRSFLTTLGVAMGVGSIVTLVSLGVGLQKITSNQIASLDALVTINVSLNKDSIKKLDSNAVEELKAIPHVALVSPSTTAASKVTYGESTSQIIIQGVNPEALSFEGINLVAGSNFANDNGIVVSTAMLKNFNVKNPSDAVGQKVKLTMVIISTDPNSVGNLSSVDLNETITGVYNDDVTSSAVISLSKAEVATGITTFNSVKVKVDNKSNVETVRNTIEKDGFITASVVDLINQVDKVFLITEIILGIIGGVALIVALIGIVNIMTISLLERTHEVGIMKAIGATNLDIKRIFEYEVIMFGLFGSFSGVLGMWLFGVFINFMVGFLMKQSGIAGNLTIFVTPTYFAGAMIILTVLVSLMAGLYPAKRASRLSPLEALRYE